MAILLEQLGDVSFHLRRIASYKQICTSWTHFAKKSGAMWRAKQMVSTDSRVGHMHDLLAGVLSQTLTLRATAVKLTVKATHRSHLHLNGCLVGSKLIGEARAAVCVQLFGCQLQRCVCYLWYREYALAAGARAM